MILLKIAKRLILYQIAFLFVLLYFSILIWAAVDQKIEFSEKKAYGLRQFVLRRRPIKLILGGVRTY